MCRFLRNLLILFSLTTPTIAQQSSNEQLETLKQNQDLGGFRVLNLYSGDNNKIIGAKFLHVATGAPIFLVQMETVPQAFIWFDVPVDSNKGLPHALEHLLALKGTKGRYLALLRDMRMSRFTAATGQDYMYCAGSAPIGLDDFFEQFHVWLDALFRPDFSDTEAEREFYHFGVADDPPTKKKRLIEQGTVYDEMLHNQGAYTYFFELRKLVLGQNNPFGFQATGEPEEMRTVTPREIRLFHTAKYHLGPTTGFIFILDPKEDVTRFLGRMSREFEEFKSNSDAVANPAAIPQPKYSIQPSQNLEPRTYQFPSGRESDAGEIAFGWKTVKSESLVQLKMLQLLFAGLADGEQSVLYRSLVDERTREVNAGIKTIEPEVFLGNSPAFPSEYLTISGIPGNRISTDQIKQLREHILVKIRQIAEYKDQSQGLADFNELIKVRAKSWRRSERVWVKTSPLFGSQIGTDWKKHFNYLSLDPSFVISLSDEPVWDSIDRQLQSNKNVWRDLINHFRLLELPYATASTPSPQMLQTLERNKEERALQELVTLKDRYHVADDQEALSKFENEERAKDREIEAIEARVPRPRFTDHPPLTLDDQIHYSQYRLLGSVPVIATTFDNPPTIDLGLSFDLNGLPKKYFKYLPLLPRCFDSVGLKKGNQIISHSDLLSEIQSKILNFTVEYESNGVSKREDLTFRASAINPKEFRTALDLIDQMIRGAYIDLANASRLRELVTQRLFADDSFTKQPEQRWLPAPTYSFRYQNDPLYLALESQFTRAHWDNRLEWLLHSPVGTEERKNLERFASEELASLSGKSRAEVVHTLSGFKATGLNAELVEYWERNLQSFPERELIQGLQRLSSEVQEDLRTGPVTAISEIKELMALVVNRNALHIDLTLPTSTLESINLDLTAFLRSIPANPRASESNQSDPPTMPIMAHVAARYNLANQSFPWYLGLAIPDAATGNLVFFADFPDYSQLDRETLIKVLSSKLCFGSAPHGFMMKTLATGLAYNNFGGSDRRSKLLFYVADRSPDIPSLVGMVNSVAAGIPQLKDPLLVDYTLRQTFSIPRSIYSFSVRGREIAHDLRDGVEPDIVRRASEAILKLRSDPNLSSELAASGFKSICGILMDKKCEQEHHSERSMFFIVGSEKTIADASKRLSIPQLLEVWPSDYWLDLK